MKSYLYRISLDKDNDFVVKNAKNETLMFFDKIFIAYWYCMGLIDGQDADISMVRLTPKARAKALEYDGNRDIVKRLTHA